MTEEQERHIVVGGPDTMGRIALVMPTHMESFKLALHVIENMTDFVVVVVDSLSEMFTRAKETLGSVFKSYKEYVQMETVRSQQLPKPQKAFEAKAQRLHYKQTMVVNRRPRNIVARSHC